MPSPTSSYAREAALLLGERIRVGRRSRGWSQRELAERAGVSVPTLRKAEGGDPGVAIGTVFELAALTGVALFHDDRERLTLDLDRTRARSALLPQRVMARRDDVHDDF